MKRLAVLCLLAAAFLSAQPVPRELRGERLLVISPMTGAGTAEDPRRPAVIPPPADWNSSETAGKRAQGDGILGYSFTLSDDGNYALVELVARTPDAFQEIHAEKNRRNWTVFRKGAVTKADIEKEFCKHKPDFDADTFTGPKEQRDRAARPGASMKRRLLLLAILLSAIAPLGAAYTYFFTDPFAGYIFSPGPAPGGKNIQATYIGAQDIYESGYCVTASGAPCYEADIAARSEEQAKGRPDVPLSRNAQGLYNQMSARRSASNQLIGAVAGASVAAGAAAAVAPIAGQAANTLAFGPSAGRLFWSGGEGAARLAAEASGLGYTIGQSRLGGGYERLSQHLPRAVVREGWSILSRPWASGASGTVNTFTRNPHPGGPDPSITEVGSKPSGRTNAVGRCTRRGFGVREVCHVGGKPRCT